MPIALHLGGLYEQLLYRLIPLPARSQETLAELIERVEQAQAKQREVDKMTVRLAKEKQFNRKVESNAQLRQLKKDHAALIREERARSLKSCRTLADRRAQKSSFPIAAKSGKIVGRCTVGHPRTKNSDSRKAVKHLGLVRKSSAK